MKLKTSRYFLMAIFLVVGASLYFLWGMPAGIQIGYDERPAYVDDVDELYRSDCLQAFPATNLATDVYCIPISLRSGVNLYRSKAAVLTLTDIDVAASFVHDWRDGTFGILFFLREDRRTSFSEWTHANIGQWILVYLNGDLIDSIRVDPPLREVFAAGHYSSDSEAYKQLQFLKTDCLISVGAPVGGDAPGEKNR
ncbi:MAG: hypothetical protein IT449_12710 [Phycisphaerales bacterium]|nr:hypothetical protein [Phycisphaerales bacterium]